MAEIDVFSKGPFLFAEQVKSLVSGETDLVANLANAAAAIHRRGNYLWTGFYLVKKQELVLGPFQGPVACTRIGFGKGVCGAAWQQKKTIVVPDVDKFPGHIACSSLSRSEIVVPLIKDNEVVAVLDIDSQFEHHFTDADVPWLEKIAQHLASIWN